MNKRPAFQFYAADWRKDPALGICSLAARGLWIEMMCLAHESDEYGVLQINGTPLTASQIARACKCTDKEATSLLRELETAGVFSRNDSGAIFSRRMVKDERLRLVRAEAGKLGGNPALLKQTDKRAVKDGDNTQANQSAKQKTTPSSSSSSSEDVSDRCPHSEIIEAYHRILPTCRKVRDWTSQRKAHLRARWNDSVDRQCISFWERLFEYISKSDFLMGRTASPGHTPFDLGLDWIILPENFAKIIEGRYDNQ